MNLKQGEMKESKNDTQVLVWANVWMMTSFIKLESTEFETVRGNESIGNEEFCFEHVKFEKPIKYPNKQLDLYT